MRQLAYGIPRSARDDSRSFGEHNESQGHMKAKNTAKASGLTTERYHSRESENLKRCGIQRAIIKQPLLCLCSIILFFAPILANATSLTPKQQAFVQSFLPMVESANARLAKKRRKLMQLYNTRKRGIALSKEQLDWLTALSQNYGITATTQAINWQLLLKRVDIIPTSLVLAQAAIESAWGSSRFAKEGNNFFGQYCYRQNCGIVPKQRPPGSTYELSVFPSPSTAIKSYMHNLNTSQHYQSFRDLRYQQRQLDQALNSLQLTEGLLRYSIKRNAYITSLQTVIVNKNLQQHDKNWHLNIAALERGDFT